MTTTLPAPATTKPESATLTATHGRISDYAYANDRAYERALLRISYPKAIEILAQLEDEIAEALTHPVNFARDKYEAQAVRNAKIADLAIAAVRRFQEQQCKAIDVPSVY